MNSCNGRTDASVKLYLLPRRQMTKKKTKIIKSCLNPEWNEEFEFRSVTLEDLKTRRVLECSVWDYDIRGCNDFIGCIRLGPNPESCEREEWMDSFGEEVSQWEAMLANPEEWVEREHILRPTIAMLGESGGLGEAEVAPVEHQQDPAVMNGAYSTSIQTTASSATEQTTPPEDRRLLDTHPTDSILETVDQPISDDEEENTSDEVCMTPILLA